jgi:hypothetical protein
MPALIAAGGSLLGGLLGGSSARRAAQIQADAQREAARLAAEEARFRPVGITTRFGSSNFTTDANGRVSGAGYTLDPQLAAMQDRFLGLAGGGLSQAEQAQQQFAPLGQAAQGLFGLGQQYLAQSPQEAAQQYMAGQQNLLAPSRERQFAQLQNQMFQTGRGGLAVGATGERPSGAAGLGAANPELEAYYNAIAQQDAGLAAQAQQAGQQQVAFGAGLFGTGGNLLTQGYGGQAAALSPYEAYMGQARQLEALGQQPLQLGIDIGAKGQSTAGANALLMGGNAAAATQARADAYNPFATALTMGSQNPAFASGVRNLFSGGAAQPSAGNLAGSSFAYDTFGNPVPII